MRNYQDWIAAYMEYTSTSEAPDSYHLFCAISTISSALGRKCWNDQRQYIWIPNCFIFLVGPPGAVKKSTTIDLGFELARDLPGIVFAAQTSTLQALVKKMAENTTTTLLEDGTQLTHSTITGSIRELGTFLKLDDSDSINSLCALWDGSKRPFDTETKNRGSFSIPNPYINLIGGTTPSWIKDNLDKHFVGSGLASRSLFVYEERARHYNALPSRTMRLAGINDSDIKQKLMEDLYEISLLSGEFYFTDEAEEWTINWYEGPGGIMSEESQAKYASLRLSDYLSRKQTHLVKLAMCISAARGNNKQIEKCHLEVADQILARAEYDMSYLFGFIGMSDVSRYTHDLLAIIKTAKMVPKKKLWRMVRNQIGSWKLFDDAVFALSRADHIELLADGDDIKIIYKKGSGDRPPGV